jgi:predicted small integral membrane protein
MNLSSSFKYWSVWRTARVITSLFILMVAAYYLVVGFDNITNPTNPNASNWPFVKGVLSGDGVPADSGFEWRFIDATWFQAASYIAVMACETLTGILLLIAGILGLRASASSGRWNHAQKLTFLGGFLGLAVFFFGFMVVGGNWFIMYLNSKWNGLTPAFQNSVMTITMLILTVGVMIGGQLYAEKDERETPPN